MNKLLVTPEDAAELLSIGRTTVYELIKEGTLQSVKIGRARRVSHYSLQRYVERLSEASYAGLDWCTEVLRVPELLESV